MDGRTAASVSRFLQTADAMFWKLINCVQRVGWIIAEFTTIFTSASRCVIGRSLVEPEVACDCLCNASLFLFVDRFSYKAQQQHQSEHKKERKKKVRARHWGLTHESCNLPIESARLKVKLEQSFLHWCQNFSSLPSLGSFSSLLLLCANAVVSEKLKKGKKRKRKKNFCSPDFPPRFGFRSAFFRQLIARV